ncbi:MAG TPA: hypothetical protein VHA11_12415, partial [Bryobacteraceae bacterium]|nr:hypothetical protein [Bryobacteraceae bacterium]
MMSAFSSIYLEKDLEVRRLLAGVKCPAVERVGELLAKSRGEDLALSELAELLEIGAVAEAGGPQFALLRAFTETEYRRADGNRVRYVAPIYVSSHCIDTCGYCNFSANRKATVRRRLSLEELDAEVETVMSRDARAIELVYATDPEFTLDLLVRYTARVAEALHDEPGSGVLLCTEYLSAEAYEALADAGLWGMVQWDETLDRGEYNRWHASSPHKREFIARMDTHDRALAAGLEVATGAL